MKYGYSRFLSPSVFLLDLILLNMSLHLISRLFGEDTVLAGGFLSLSFIFSVAWVIVSWFSSNNVFKRPLVLIHQLNRLVASVFYHFVIVIGALYFFHIYISVSVLAAFYLSFLLLLVFQRSGLIFLLDYSRKRGFNQRRVLLIGDPNISERIKTSFRYHPEYGYKVASFVTKEGNRPSSKEELEAIIEQHGIHEIYFCYKEIDNRYVEELSGWMENSGIEVKMISDLNIDPFRIKLQRLYDFPVLDLLAKPDEDIKIRFLKRFFDLAFSSAVMIAGAPVFLILIAGTKLTSRGPVFYAQSRLGRDGKPFKIYKFRSMRMDAEKDGPQLAKEYDPRVTRWGRAIRKTRLDELPQFYNVFKGEMSVVGPRPEREYFIEQIIARAPSYKRLLLVKPGITSIGQIKFGYAENVDQMVKRMRYDLLYLNNRKLRVDMRIIAGTVRVMIQGKGK